MNWLSRTMLIERLTGVTVYAVVLFIMYYYLRHAQNYRSVKRTLNTYLFILCVMAFFYIPAESADLYRWLYLTDNWHSMSLSQFYDSYLSKVTTPAAYLLIYLCRLTRIDGVLPTVCAFLFFYCVFYILKDLYKRHGVSASSLATALLMFMATGTFLEVISGVRCMLSVSILTACFYDEIYNNKPIWKNFIWEICAALIHSMAVIVLLIRLFFFVFQKGSRKTYKFFNLCFIGLIAFLVYRFGFSYVETAILKAENYATSDTAYSYAWEYLLRGIVMIQLVSILLTSRGTQMSTEFVSFRRFNILLIIIELAFAFEYNIFHRMTTVSLIMMMPVLVKCLDEEQFPKLKQTVTLLSFVVLLLACARGNLCGYKFFLLS